MKLKLKEKSVCVVKFPNEEQFSVMISPRIGCHEILQAELYSLLDLKEEL